VTDATGGTVGFDSGGALVCFLFAALGRARDGLGTVMKRSDGGCLGVSYVSEYSYSITGAAGYLYRVRGGGPCQHDLHSPDLAGFVRGEESIHVWGLPGPDDFGLVDMGVVVDRLFVGLSPGFQLTRMRCLPPC
jgi:hypothetical protein